MQKPMNDLLRGLGLTPYPAAPSFDSPVNPLPATIPMPEDALKRKNADDPLRNLKKQVTPREELPPYSDPNSI